MSEISNYLQQIRTAVYGSQVRDSIANGIEQCYSDVTNAKTIADNSIEAAQEEADRAAASAQQASQAYTNARNQREAAESARDYADGKAAEAAASASTALGYSQDAETSATNAEQSAQDAAGYAQDAADIGDFATPLEILNYLDLTEPRTSMDRVFYPTGSNPEIIGESDCQYICTELASVSITPPLEGLIDVIFRSGTTPTLLTVSGNVQWPSWFDPEHLEADVTYELNIMHGVYGVVAIWD